jgi:thimet oligopeptidase
MARTPPPRRRSRALRHAGRFVLFYALAACATAHGPPAHSMLEDSAMTPAPYAPTAADYASRCAANLAEAQASLAALEALSPPYTTATLLEPLNALWRAIDRGLNLAGLFRNVHPDLQIREHADQCEQDFQKLVTDMGLSRQLYEAVSALDVSHEDAITKRLVRHMLRDFVRAGVDKDAATRERIRDLKEALVRIGQAFDKNIRQDVRHMTVRPQALAGLPEDYVAAHPANDRGEVVLSTDTPDYLPFMSYAHDDAARLSFYSTFRQRGYPANAPVLQEMLEKRYALANLLGYPNWAAYITEDKMIKTATAAQTFIDKITQVATPRAARDYQELLAQLQKEMPHAEEVGDWQKAYIEERVKQQAYSFDSQAARSYFPFGKVRDGLLATTAKMFGVSYKKINVPVWHEEVEAYEISDRDIVIGRFYLDLHPRENKYKHAAAFPLRSGIANVQLPEAALVCNFPAGENALMEHDEVETFFHEFGHLLHHLFAGQQRWIGVSGIATEWDFVEAPSQMLEEWTYDAATLKSFAVNSQGETISDDLIAAMRRARDFGKGLWVRHQMFYAAVSLAFHDRNPAGLDADALMQTLQTRYSPFAYVDGTHFQLSFGHLDGYSAIYYTYMWSLVIAKDLFSVFEAPALHDGLSNREVATRYRRLVLEPGGSADAAVLVHNFLQRDFSFDAFDRWINAD